MLSRIAVALIAAAVAVTRTPAFAQSREVLKFNLTSAEPAIEAATGDGFVVRADRSDLGWGWWLGVFRSGSNDNLLYPHGNWHGAFPCQIVPSPELRKIFPDERVIRVRSTCKAVTLQLSGLAYEQNPPWRFTAGTARVLWGEISENELAPTAQGASEENGNIWITDTGGCKRQITDTRMDCCPAVSADGQRITFVRKTQGIKVKVGWGSAEANEIWIVDVKGHQRRSLARGADRFYGSAPLAELGRPQFSPDGTRVYFWGAAAAVSGAVYAVELGTGALQFISGGHNVEVIQRGPYRGCLIVQKHKYFIGGGSYDWFWLLNRNGEEVGPVGSGPTFLTEAWIEDNLGATPGDCD